MMYTKRMRKTLLSGAIALTAHALLLAAPAKLAVKGGASVTTNGWADIGRMAYADAGVIVIDDETYRTAADKRAAFTNAIASGSVDSSGLTDTPALIVLCGTVDLSDGAVSDSDHSYFNEFDPQTHKRLHKDFSYDIGSNKTIIGAREAKIAYGGLRIKAFEGQEKKNIIIRNISFWDAHGSTEYDTSIPEFADKKASADQLVIEATFPKDVYTGIPVPENIWIDHCTFSDGVCVDLDRNYNHDGALDIKAGRNITVSYCEFTNHDKVTLSGSSDNFVEPGDREVTFHHNYYHGCVQRMPRTRGGYFHLYNNVFEDIGTARNSGASLGPGRGAQFIVEGNVFGKHAGPILNAADSSKPGEPTFYKIYVSGNTPEISAENSQGFEGHQVTSKPWPVPYKYKATSAGKAQASVKKEAGAGIKSVTVNGARY